MALIPDKNPKALIAYYLGFVSLIPLIGFVAAIAAIILGVQGLQAAKRDPSVEGKGHAIVGIVLAVVGAVMWGGCLGLGLLGAILG